MKFSIALFAIISAVPTAVQASPIKTCTDQKSCLGFEITKVVDDLLCTAGQPTCEFEICMTLQMGGAGCAKGLGNAISHTCVKPETECLNGGSFGLPTGTAPLNEVDDGSTFCQTVSPGGTAEFLVKDGSGTCGVLDSPLIFGDSNDPTADCGPLEVGTEDIDYKSCTGNKNKECVWTIIAPLCDDTTPTGSDSDERIGTSDTTTAEEDAYLCA
jgi:hypothetical protein